MMEQLFLWFNGFGSANGLILSLILGFSKRGNRKANRWLALLLFLFSLEMANTIYHGSGLFRSWPFFIAVPDFIHFSFGPLAFLYVRSLLAPERAWQRRDLLNFLPMLLGFILNLPVILSPAAKKIDWMERMQTDPPPVTYAWTAAALAVGLIYWTLIVPYIRRYRENARSDSGRFDQINLKWTRRVLTASISIWTMVLLLSVLIFLGFMMQMELEGIIYLVIAICLFAMGYQVFLHPEIFIAVKTEPKKKYEKSTLLPESAENHLQKLLELMSREKPYLESNLTLQQVADRLDIPAYHLSQVINDRCRQNFFEFVNQYRTSEAKLRLVDPTRRRDKLLTIAFDSGFNSLSTFNRVFKEQTGMSPSAFRRSQKSR